MDYSATLIVIIQAIERNKRSECQLSHVNSPTSLFSCVFVPTGRRSE